MLAVNVKDDTTSSYEPLGSHVHMHAPGLYLGTYASMHSLFIICLYIIDMRRFNFFDF